MSQRFIKTAAFLFVLLCSGSVYSDFRGNYSFHRYSDTRSAIYSNDPEWVYEIKDVCDYQFADYHGKNGPALALFIAYKDGRAGIYILPLDGTAIVSYFEFEKKFEIRQDGVCHIFDGIDEHHRKKFVYFRVVDNQGETVNYAVFEGDF